MRQILVESLVLAAAGGALGLAFGALGARGPRRSSPRTPSTSGSLWA
jgi:hypothetical protein